MKFITNLTQKRLKEVLHYDPQTGIFTWLVSLSKRVKIGDKAGTCKNNGYIRIDIDGYFYYAHRLAWLYAYGYWPKELDHKDNKRDNNKIENLREATRSQNNKNRASYGKNTFGKGIYKYRGKYKVVICVGTYDTIEEAKKIRNKLYKEYQQEFTHISI